MSEREMTGFRFSAGNVATLAFLGSLDWVACKPPAAGYDGLWVRRQALVRFSDIPEFYVYELNDGSMTMEGAEIASLQMAVKRHADA